jgi:uncharacterized protein
MAVDPICGMQVDETSSIKINFNGINYYFCSEHCRSKFAGNNNIKNADILCGACGSSRPAAWWKNKIFILSVIYLLVFFLADHFGPMALLKESLWMYLKTILIPVSIGLVLGGVIDWLVPGEYISLLLAQKKKRTIIYSVMTGFLMSACSHGILALAIQLYKKGASPPATVAFLLASPWANLPLTIIMFGFFGFKALFIIISAIIIALITGYIFMFLEKLNLIEHNSNTLEVAEGFSVVSDIKSRVKAIKVSASSFAGAIASVWAGTMSLANMVLWWIMLGALLASIAAAYLPEHFMHQYMGPTFLGLLVTLMVATVIEICSEGSAPLAFEIFRQTGALGNSFVFLMAGVVTDYTEIGLLWANIGWRTAVWLPVVTVPQVVLLGAIANMFI